MAISTKAIARIIEADILREPEARPTHNVMGCLTCGRQFLYKRPSGDNSGRFCSIRCRESYDAGAPAWDEAKEKNLKYLTPPLAGCRTVAGPGLGLNPWQSVLDASARVRRKIEKRKNRLNQKAKSMASEGANL